MKKVRAIVVLMSTPISCAASRSCEVDRIARPRFVRVTKAWSATMRASVITTMKTLVYLMITPPMSNDDSILISCGTTTGADPKRI